VINENGATAAQPGPPRGPQPRPADESRPRADRRGEASTDSLRAITAGAAGLTASADPSAAASEAYGRDDPAYGPPRPGWYDNEQAASYGEHAASYGEHAAGEPAAQTAQTAQPETAPPAAAQAAATGPIELNPHVVRGPFEPVVEAASLTSASDAAGEAYEAQGMRAEGMRAEGTRAEGTRAEPWEDGRDVGGTAAWSTADERSTAWSTADERSTAWSSADEPDGAPTGMSEYEPSSYEFPGLADDDPAGSADAALDRLKALHLTAAAVAPQSLDAHFDQLLERQRRLISEYLGQAGGPGTPAAASITTAEDDYAGGSLVGFGDDHWSTR
jgi:hypothetical protein